MRKLVLWGHDVDDYSEMFALSEQQLNSSLLELGCGPSAVNSQITERGGNIISCDKMFAKDKDSLQHYVDEVFDFMIDEVEKHQQLFQWGAYGSLEHFVAKRRQGIELFFKDFDQGKEQGRYISAKKDDELPFADFSFEVALCSHYLFANLDNQDVDYHLRVIRELARVAKEVRLFPLIDRDANVSQFLGPVLLGLQQQNFGVEVKQVDYNLQPKGNAMLRVWALQCSVD